MAKVEVLVTLATILVTISSPDNELVLFGLQSVAFGIKITIVIIDIKKLISTSNFASLV